MGHAPLFARPFPHEPCCGVSHYLCTQAIDLVNSGLPEDQHYVPGSCAKLGYGVERFLFLKVGQFPDIYEFLTKHHMSRSDQQSALVTSEKAYSVFKGW